MLLTPSRCVNALSESLAQQRRQFFISIHVTVHHLHMLGSGPYSQSANQKCCTFETKFILKATLLFDYHPPAFDTG